MNEKECEHNREIKNVEVGLETREYMEKKFKLGTKKLKAIPTQIEKYNSKNRAKKEKILHLFHSYFFE